jgi:imidazolonepropionase-like amidohydrolase
MPLTTHRTAFIIATGLITACGAPSEETVAPATTAVVYDGARLIAGDGSAPIENGVLVVDEGVITAVGTTGEVTTPEGAARVDLAGKTVMPAIVDLHGHVGYQRGLSYDEANYTRENLIDHLNRYAYYGVGTIVSMGTDPGELAFQIRAEQDVDALGGARLHTAFRGFARPDAGPGAAALRPSAFGVSTPGEGRALVGDVSATPADFVKIWVDDRLGRVEKLTHDLYGPIIDEAHARNLPVIAHVFYHDDAVELVEAGVNGFAHLVRDAEMSDALVAAIVERGVFVMPNLGISERGRHAVPPAWLDDPFLLESVSAEEVARLRESFEGRTPEAAERGRTSYGAMERSLRKLANAGATIVLGADTGVTDHFFGYTEHRELELIVNAGVPTSEAIVAATSRAADTLGVNTGLLAAGRRADLLVLDANPLDDITNTRRIADVYLRGERLDRAALRVDWAAGAP